MVYQRSFNLKWFYLFKNKSWIYKIKDKLSNKSLVVIFGSLLKPDVGDIERYEGLSLNFLWLTEILSEEV